MSSPARSWVPRFFPPSTFSAVPRTDVQADFRQRFAAWGCPLRVRVDNGNPWGNWNDLPTVLALWLLGLGVTVLWNAPGHPEQNPKVERSQSTGRRWAEPQQCQSVAELQTHFDHVDRIQRERYPTVDGQSRLAMFPELGQVQRRYSRTWERQHWDLQRVADHLAGYTAVRQVDSSGHTSVYDSRYYLGKAQRRQPLYVTFDPTAYEWVFADGDGRQVRRFPAQQITRARIVALQLKGDS
jgi:hypothetical protein